MNRRQFLWTLTKGGIAVGVMGLTAYGKESGATEPVAEASSHRVVLYDTYAMALYFDGSLGPKTGIIKVDYVIEGMPLLMRFWHGHNGKNHEFTLEPSHYEDLKALKRVTIETTTVADHSHKLFIDPIDVRYRVPGAQPIEV